MRIRDGPGQSCVRHRRDRAGRSRKFAPGKILAEANAGSGEHRRVFYRDLSYEPLTVNVPGVDTLLMVDYREGRTTMRRRVEGGWQERVIEPVAISILGPGRPSEWEWGESIGVPHLYLSREFMADTAARAFDQDLERFDPADALPVDSTLWALADTLAGELRRPGPASNLLVNSVAQALSEHTLRAYHRCERAGPERRRLLRVDAYAAPARYRLH